MGQSLINNLWRWRRSIFAMAFIVSKKRFSCSLQNSGYPITIMQCWWQIPFLDVDDDNNLQPHKTCTSKSSRTAVQLSPTLFLQSEYENDPPSTHNQTKRGTFVRNDSDTTNWWALHSSPHLYYMQLFLSFREICFPISRKLHWIINLHRFWV